jgi:nitrate reductase molybdenum cofactor assembly chaperone
VRPPRASREPFAIFLQWLSRTSPDTVAKHYVETFDLRRRCALYLTYYQCGDTRKRGMAMLACKTAYRTEGLEPTDSELPDYLPLVLDFAALGIISTAAFSLGPSWLSLALLAAASSGLVVLGSALVMRLYFRSSMAADIQAADRMFGFFTITAGLDVLGVRLMLAGHPLATAILAAVAAAFLVSAWPLQSGLLAPAAATGSSPTSPLCGASSSPSACTASQR